MSAMAGLLVGAVGCYIWREVHLRRQLRQILSVMETAQQPEDISLPMVSKLRRQAMISQQQQHKLLQQLSSWQNALEQAPIGYLQLNDENQVLACNQIARHLLQVREWDSGQDRLLLELVRSYELDRLIEKTRSNQLAQELIWQFYSGYKSTDSQSIWLKANSVPLIDGEIGVFIESQQIQIDAAVARERWLTDLAHEIRTPLTSIRLVAETLENKVAPNLTRWVQRMLTETTRMIDLVQHFLELSQLETAPAQYLSRKKIDLVGLIGDTWHSLEPIAGQKSIEFCYSGLEELCLEIDRAKFIQVFINLFDNSIKYCPEFGHIWIDIHLVKLAETNAVEINLHDDGNGFAEIDLPYVFDRLYRGDVSRQHQPKADSNFERQTTGSGLGLAIVRQIVLAHSGTISAANHLTTGGAVIKLILPLPT